MKTVSAPTVRSRVLTLLCLLTLCLSVATKLVAQDASLKFDVASVKENKTGMAGTRMRLMPGGGITAENLPAHAMITIAYDLQAFQLVGGPAWLSDSYYDIIAKPAATATREQAKNGASRSKCLSSIASKDQLPTEQGDGDEGNLQAPGCEA
jgi:hypothetical protein